MNGKGRRRANCFPLPNFSPNFVFEKKINMKIFNSFALLLISIFLFLFSEVKSREISNITEFLGRQPHARSEAMGRGYAAIYDDHTALFNNPASLILDTSAYYFSASQLVYPVPTAYDTFTYNYAGFGYSFSKYFSTALSVRHWQLGFRELDGSVPFSLSYTFSASSEFLDDWFAGVNIHAFQHKPGPNERAWTFYSDAGLLRKFKIEDPDRLFRHNISAGFSWINFSYSEYEISMRYKLPVIIKPAMSYAIGFNESLNYRNFDPARLLLHLEWQNVLNHDLYTSYRFGLEATLMEVLSLRGGFYSETRPDVNEEISRLDNKFTYGIGVFLPMQRLTGLDLPLDINIDFTLLSQSFEAGPGGIQSPLFYIWGIRVKYFN